MDYTKEHCYNMFTQGQKEHMRYVLQEKRAGLLAGDVISVNPYNQDMVKVQIWPNPAADKLNVQTEINRDAQYTISNLLGETILQGALTTPVIDIATLSSGIYILSVNSRKAYGMTRFVVQ